MFEMSNQKNKKLYDLFAERIRMKYLEKKFNAHIEEQLNANERTKKLKKFINQLND